MARTAALRPVLAVWLVAGWLCCVADAADAADAAGAAGAAAPVNAKGEAAAAPNLGPRAVVTMTTREMLDTARNDQKVRLRGRIVSLEGGRNYVFGDDTGTVPVAITRAQLPGRQELHAGQRVQLDGVVHRETRDLLEFRVTLVRRRE